MKKAPIPVEAAPAPRPIGTARGEFVVPVDFNEPLPEDVLAQFECPSERKNQIRNAVAGIRALRAKIAGRKGFQPLTDAEIKSAINEGRP